jgi:P-type E1-E2 ATPase
MVIAIVASLALYQFLPAIVITFFALLSEFIEGYIVEKGRKNIQLLYNLSPRKAIIKRNHKNGDEESVTETTRETPIDEVRLGDIVIVREGDTIPVDGHILRGASTVDQSSITGESAPIEKSVGDSAFAGTINLTQKLEIICEKLYNDTTFAKIIRLVEEAEASKAPIQKISDKLATRLIQFAIGLSVLTFIVTHNVVSTLSVIVVAGACGLAVGTPIALLATNGKLSRRGVIVKGGLQIENLNSAGTIVFDKTGTLTSGKPGVSQVISFDPRIDPIRILEYAAIAE